MGEKANPNRIPAESADHWRSWAMPVIGDDGSVVSADKNKGRQADESIEDVELDNLPSGGMTAEQLAEIVGQAEQEGFAKGREDGFKTGYDEGYLSGQQQGALDMRQQLVAEQKTFQSLVEAFSRPLNDQDEKLEKLLLNMVGRMTRAVVMRELTTDSGDILALVRQSIAALPAGSEVMTVHLNPEDLAVVEAYSKDHSLDWHFHPDPDLTPGGVKVSTRDSHVDYSVERRLEEVIERFLSQQEVDEKTSDEALLASPEDAAQQVPDDPIPTPDEPSSSIGDLDGDGEPPHG
ncbi:flagellar assembly protein FliH [Gilvimarinus algae]|uniref:Flagellar assembly protein FliH n=1 Tax=Gilvimarinus algae TaxID=3058037 RepID=A0ABT8TEU1_9GAMM|nr:flagellar assembly protein FliH [Gilvimarinus sp. SDUM040014]MDO3382594.1 flagellar assembly protein FliH [Gilvimarinus sp. SDUM040014]